MKCLRELRRERKLTQRELGEKIGISMSSIAMYETGDRIPSLKKAKKIAKFFQIPLEEISFGESVNN
ncbi:helix-turn-helix domain-containing protein [Wukongibacter sp. M2B1]|uniref:helix-turn-helix domain-containing protein n=1 Tax=Wukongibacter sp. M2B1 TaxID=3088895 RepID=UPI003D79D99B